MVDSKRGNPDVKATRNGARQRDGKSRRHPPQKRPFSWGSGLHLPRSSLGPPQSASLYGISIGSAVFAGLEVVTERQTDRQTTSVAIGRI